MARACLQRILFVVLMCLSAGAGEPQWIRVSSSHFTVLTDAGASKGQDAAYRFELLRSLFSQLLMRTKVNVSQPLEIMVLRGYSQVVPSTYAAPGFYLGGDDRSYVILDAARDDNWRAVSHPFAHLLLNYNYPPTQAWFDEGFAAYFSSSRMDKQVQLGSDPDALSDLLKTSPWIPVAELFSTRTDPAQESTRHTMFHAESWMLMHYLLNQNKLGETGTYFGLVQNQRVPVEQAIQQAYGMPAAQLDQAVKDYFRALTNPEHAQPAPVEPGDVGASTQDVPATEAQALVGEVMLRVPERRDQGIQQLQSIINQPKLDSAIAHRALAWDHMQRKEFDQAIEDLNKALQLNADDPWTHFYLAQVKYNAAQASGQPFKGLANMMQDLRIVLDWYPEFAEAYSMLGMARVEGGGINAAMESMHAAMLLSPRSEPYMLNMAQIYLADKKWDAAANMLERLKSSADPRITQAAAKSMADLPALRKYGMLPPTSAPTAGAPASPPKAAVQPQEAVESEEPERPLEPMPDKRKMQFGKGKLLSVDCSQAPVAVLTVLAGGRKMRLRTDDYKSLLLIGEDNFSCVWANRAVAFNYKAGGKADGDLVSLELQ